MRQAEVFATGFMFCECPRWHDGRLWVSDFYLKQVFTVDAEGNIVNSMIDRKVLRHETGGLVEHADLRGIAPCYACALGGTQMTTLFLTTNARGEPRRGQIEVVEVDVPGVGSP